MIISKESEYDQKQIKVLELLWGKGFLSPGGTEEIDLIVNQRNLENKTILDIGCGSGGALIYFSEKFNIKQAIGIDIEPHVINQANFHKNNSKNPEKLDFEVVSPGKFNFGDESFDVIFSKDSFLHIENKENLCRDIFRLLKPGGFLIASDWMRIDDNIPSHEMKEYIIAEGLSMQMCSLKRYFNALTESGFINIKIKDRNKWYTNLAKQEILDLRGKLWVNLVKILGKNEANKTIHIWEKMLGVLKSGEHRPGHFMADKPF